ncbi:hypothetical protein SUGI_0227960 [Cryptomeria japonica]|uniref:uncharacterized protein LOC131034253 n=1 Tax=Cryptomeria japonica TaxID=3369 RepID=UPI002408DE27|nr:uncharacterized protein LOC131034253 [Cryptomeria japonica]GLJ14204.1 hypothetical protein SUGI_0227960 [Cryptomeria japonica]
MALQWVMLGYVVAAEALLALALTMPWPRAWISPIVTSISQLLQPCIGIIPFAAFQLLDIYWKNEHRLVCTSHECTVEEMNRYERSIYKAQRNAILSVIACFLYWILYRVCIYYNEIRKLEDEIKRRKDD